MWLSGNDEEDGSEISSLGDKVGDCGKFSGSKENRSGVSEKQWPWFLSLRISRDIHVQIFYRKLKIEYIAQKRGRY